MTASVQATEILVKHPDEVLPMSIIFTPILQSDETLSSITSVTEVDGDGALTFGTPSVNAAVVKNNAGSQVAAIGKAAQFSVSGGTNKTKYWFKVKGVGSASPHTPVVVCGLYVWDGLD